MLATVLVARLNKVIGSVIHHNQTGFIKDRQMKDNIRKVINIIDSAMNINISMVCVFADAEKAFDKLEWGLISTMLDKIGLGNKIKAWFHAVYRNPQAIIKVNDDLEYKDNFFIPWGASRLSIISHVIQHWVGSTGHSHQTR